MKTSSLSNHTIAAKSVRPVRRLCGLAIAALGLGASLPSAHAQVTATGGTITSYTDGGNVYVVHTFTGSGTFNVTAGGSVDYLVVGGGGGGGNGTGGGGGGGQVVTGTLSATPQSYTVTIGAGGNGGYPYAANGSSSIFGSVTSYGGAGGMSQSTNPPTVSSTYGSGGGGGCGLWATPNGTLGGPATSGQGYPGGNGDTNSATYFNGGGGGGAGGPGGNAQQGVGGNGGNGGIGIASSITGSSVYYSGGGGGGIFGGNVGDAARGTGGQGGGGQGNSLTAVATAGSPNTGGGGGGGGGGAGNGTGARGGSGIVIISYLSGSVDPLAPSTSGATLAALENTPTALTTGDFGTYSDPNSSPLTAVQIVSLPALGNLTLNGAAVTLAAPITVADINSGLLTYLTPLGYGTPYTTIGIKVGNATGHWSVPAVMTVNVTHVNHPPNSTGGSVSLKANTIKTFAAANFQFSDVDAGETLQAIEVTTLPADGTLKLGGVAITSAPSAAIPVASIPTLTYTPNTGFSGSDPFNFQVSDGTDFSTSAATMAITVTVNQVPTSTGGSVILHTDTVKTFAAANFPFADGDVGDTLQAIKVTSLPAGTLTLNGTPITSAPSADIPVADIPTLTYTPVTGYNGADSFNYQVSDGIAFSADATMAITVTSDILVQNGGFETPTPHNPNNGTNADWTAGGWAFLPAPWTSSYGGNYSRISSAPLVGTAQPGPWICNLNGSGIWIKQNLGSSVNAGDTISVTFELMSDTLPGEVTAEFQVGTGPTVYSETFASPQNNGVWVTYTLTKTVGAGVSGNLVLKLTNTGVANVNDRSWIDNISNVSVTTGSGPTPGSYAYWAQQNSASPNPLDDSNHNGVPDGIEFFMGGTLASPAIIPPLVDNAGTWTWTVPYDPSAAASYYFEVSPDLQSWTPLSPGDPSLEVLTGPDAIRLTLPSGMQFCRLAVTPAP